MAANTSPSAHSPIIEEFLEGSEDEFEELGEPPMAEHEDPLLDGERIELEEHDE